jgi:hypothetical protein
LVSDGDGVRQVFPAFLYVYVESVEAAYQRAIVSGARSIEEPKETPYGHRRAMIQDQWGNMWQIATHCSASANTQARRLPLRNGYEASDFHHQLVWRAAAAGKLQV